MLSEEEKEKKKESTLRSFVSYDEGNNATAAAAAAREIYGMEKIHTHTAAAVALQRKLGQGKKGWREKERRSSLSF